MTPFHEDSSINFDVFKDLLEFHLTHQTNAIIVCGTTGESATLTHKEHEELIDYTVKYFNGRIPVIAGILEPPNAKPVIIRDNVLVGANGVILEGITVGKNSVIAAGAVVTKNVKPDSVMAGVPAKFIKKRDTDTDSKTGLVNILRKR